MNNEQEKALASLERAFKKCSKAGISFVGMDDKIHAYDADELAQAEVAIDVASDLYEAQRACGQGETVNTHGSYLDSGGW